MNKPALKKRGNIKNLKCKQYREMAFSKGSTIIRKNQSFRHVYLLKSGEAAIFADNDPTHPLHTYKQGDYLNFIEICTENTSFKTIKAVTKCDVLLMILSKSLLDQQKKNVFIPKIQLLKFYEISLFKTLTYGLMLEMAMHFRKQNLYKTQIANFMKEKLNFTCFLITGSLLLESHQKKKQEDGLRTSQSCHRPSMKSMLEDKNLKLVKFGAGEILFHNTDEKYVYACESEKCEIIYVATDLLQYYLPSEMKNNMRDLKESQNQNIKQRRSKTFKALKSMSRSINRENARSQFIPQNFQNTIQKNAQKFEKARSVHYTKNNRQFRSFSEQKKKILQNRDKGYRQLAELNRVKYGRSYIFEKRMQIARKIHGSEFQISKHADKDYMNTTSDSVFFRSGVTLYEKAVLKDEFGLDKQSSGIKLLKKNKLNMSSGKQSANTGPFRSFKPIKNVDSLTIKSVQKIRTKFENHSKTLLKHYNKKQMKLDY